MDEASALGRMKQFGKRLYERPSRPKPPKEPKSPALLLIEITAFVTGCAAITEWVWAMLFCIEATGKINFTTDWGAASAAPTSWTWAAAFSANVPILFGLLLATVPIVAWSMIWLPMVMQARGAGRGRRVTMAIAGILANLLVILSGTIVMNGNRQDHVRGELVQEQSAAQGRAAIQARLQVAKDELARMTDSSMTSNDARAARAHVAGWRTYVAQATSDPSVPAADRQRIVRAMGSAEAADALRARIEQLTVSRATAAPEAASAAVVADNYGQGMNDFAQYAQVYRPPFVALICTLIGIWGAWWLVGVWERHLATRQEPDYDEAHMIEDHSADKPVAAQPYDQATKEAFYDGETGEKLIKVRQKAKEYLRKAPKGKKIAVDMATVPEGDEVGVFDASRTGTTNAGVEAGGDPANHESEEQSQAILEDIQNEHTTESTTPAYSAEDLDAVYALTEANEIALPAGEGVMIAEADEQDAHVREWEKAAQMGAAEAMEAAE